MDYSPGGGEWLATSSRDLSAVTLDGVQIPSLLWEWRQELFLQDPTALRPKIGTATLQLLPAGQLLSPPPSHLAQVRPPGAASAEPADDLIAEKGTVPPWPSVRSKPKAVVPTQHTGGGPVQIGTPSP